MCLSSCNRVRTSVCVHLNQELQSKTEGFNEPTFMKSVWHKLKIMAGLLQLLQLLLLHQHHTQHLQPPAAQFISKSVSFEEAFVLILPGHAEPQTQHLALKTFYTRLASSLFGVRLKHSGRSFTSSPNERGSHSSKAMDITLSLTLRLSLNTVTAWWVSELETRSWFLSDVWSTFLFLIM